MYRRVFPLLVLLAIAAVLTGCGGGNGASKTVAPATVNVSVSDPATCAASTGSTGPYKAIYVTITDVQIHTSGTAGDNDPNWVDLTPNLSTAPVQVNLLGISDNKCFLATLGSTTALQPGSYQQIRIKLADNSFKVPTDTTLNPTCRGVAANCVVLAATPNAPQPLLLSSETKTGIKIPPGQIAGGRFDIAAGETKDLNIDFDACASVVTQGNGQFRLKPVLRAGQANLTSNSINGKLVDKDGLPITFGKAIVALEENVEGTHRVFMEVTPDSNGNFNFCPVLGDGPFVVVAVAFNDQNQAFATTVTSNVRPGNALGNVKMFPVSPLGPLASLSGTVTTVNGTVGTPADIRLSALQTANIGTTSFTFTVPAGMLGSVPVIPTAKPAGCTADPCPAYTASYTMTLAAAAPTTGEFQTAGTSYTAAAAGAATYNIEAAAFTDGSLLTQKCTPSKLTNSITVPPATLIPAFTFTGCQ